jgi:hypothetical protein
MRLLVEIFRPAGMSREAKSIYYFAMYMVVIGLFLFLFPRLPLDALNMKPEGNTGHVWVRILGLLVLVFAYYYIRLSRAEVRDFFKWTVHTRGSIPVIFAVLILAGELQPILFLVALGDFAGAVWTFLALRSSANS